MTILQSCTEALPAVVTTATIRPPAAISKLILAALLFCGTAPTASAQSSTSGSLDFTKDFVLIGVGIGAVAAAVIVVAVVHSHHTLTGCVAGGPGEFELQTSDARTYALEGMTAIKVGDRIKFHGSRAKNARDSAGHPIFKVESLKKDYGPCRANSVQTAKQTP